MWRGLEVEDEILMMLIAKFIPRGSYPLYEVVIDKEKTLLAGVDQETAMALGSAFGSGMGNMEGTCGAITGAAMVLGLVKRDKLQSRRAMINIMNRFQERNSATQCKLLKGVETGNVLRSCEDCVADACEFLEKEIF